MNIGFDLTVTWPVIFGGLGALFFFFRHEATRRDIIKGLDGLAAIAKYKWLIGTLLAKLNGFYGPANSWRAFSVCLSLAYLYPLLFFFVAYAFVGPHQLAGMALAPADTEGRLLWPLGFFTFILIEIWLLLNYKRLEHWLDVAVGRIYRLKFGRRLAKSLLVGLLCFTLVYATTGNFSTSAGAFAGAGAGAFAFAFAVAFAFAFAVAGAFAVAFAFAFAVPGAFTLAVAVAGAGVWALVLALLGESKASLLLVTLFIALPLFNAALDWVSWRISRFYLRRAHDENSWSLIAGDIAIDAVIALALMVILVAGLPVLVILLNDLFSLFSDASIDWRELALTARGDPWGEGSFVSLMVVTTLLPTAMHLLLVGGALALHFVRLFRFREIVAGIGPSHLGPALAVGSAMAIVGYVCVLLFGLYHVGSRLAVTSVADKLFWVVDMLYDKNS